MGDSTLVTQPERLRVNDGLGLQNVCQGGLATAMVVGPLNPGNDVIGPLTTRFRAIYPFRGGLVPAALAHSKGKLLGAPPA